MTGGGEVDDVVAVSEAIAPRPARPRERGATPRAQRRPITADVVEQIVAPAAKPRRHRAATPGARAALAARQRALEAAAPAMRRALLEAPLDQALPLATEALAAALAPARVRVLLAEEAPAIGEPGRP